MRRGFKFPVLVEVAVGALLLRLLLALPVFLRTLLYGLGTPYPPAPGGAVLAGRLRHWSIPAELHHRKNPVPLTPAVLAEARAHFADHCASCHGNDGKGKTEMGQHLYPRAPDMTLGETQSQSDGELFATIENGVRLTGMPGWGNGTAGSGYASWTLVRFIRHLPKVTPEEIAEMEKLNPKSPDEWQQMQQEAAFLAGDQAAAPVHETEAHHHH